MSGNDRSAVYGMYAETLALPAGVTAEIKMLPNQIGVIFKYISGGSLSVVGPSVSLGSTYAINQTYLLGTGEIQNIALSGSIYLLATGSTCVLSMERLLSAKLATDTQ